MWRGERVYWGGSRLGEKEGQVPLGSPRGSSHPSFCSPGTTPLSCGGNGRGPPPGHSAPPGTAPRVTHGHRPPWHHPGGGGGGRGPPLVPPGLGGGPTEPRRCWRRPLYLVPPLRRSRPPPAAPQLVCPGCWKRRAKWSRKGRRVTKYPSAPGESHPIRVQGPWQDSPLAPT